ncbi:hypothetical protein SAMN05442782_8697 [Streptomyces sp. OK228]|nr:hypothetical protein SAMN05442782_8697 [Streptomyces sp. OK228]
MWGAHRAARVSQEALAVQVRKEDERWQREHRQTAYQALIRADMMMEAAGRAVDGKTNPENGKVPPELLTVWQEAEEASNAALSLIELCGPTSILAPARELHRAGGFQTWLKTLPPKEDRQEGLDDRLNAYSNQKDALEAFRVAAREVLGYTVP